MPKAATAEQLDAPTLRKTIDADGFWLMPRYFDAAYCARVRAFIDAFPSEEAEVNYAGTEIRIWRSHELHRDIADFRAFADGLLSRVYEKPVESRDILAIRNLPVEPTAELMEGRWHLDSMRQQIKVFLFLSKVTERTGPLEVLPGSHRAGFKLRGTAQGKLIHPRDFLGENRRYQKLDDAWVGHQVATCGGSFPMVCPAGTVAIVNTSAVHRARPCLDSSRYALTAYYDRF